MFRDWPTEEIAKYMKVIAMPFVSICENLVGDFNISQIVRSTNAFGLEGVAICGRRKWDRRGAVGTQHYTQIDHYSEVLDAIKDYRDRGYRIVAAELSEYSIGRAKALNLYKWEKNTAVLFGEEGRGLSEEAIDAADDVVFIPQRGTVPSLNVAGCAQIMMYDYVYGVNKC